MFTAVRWTPPPKKKNHDSTLSVARPIFQSWHRTVGSKLLSRLAVAFSDNSPPRSPITCSSHIPAAAARQSVSVHAACRCGTVGRCC